MATAPTAAAATDPRELARQSGLAVRARVVVEGAFAGMHHNLHAGTSMEFTEHKEYAPGDEIRRIDWKAVGRVDRYYVKRFEDETEMRTFLVVDASASMGYGRRGTTKLEYASTLAAALAYLLGQQGDAAGLLTFGGDADDEGTRYLPPSTRSGQVREIFAQLETCRPAGTADWPKILGKLGEVADRRGLLVLFTDLLDADAAESAAAARDDVPELATRLRHLRARGHDVVVFHILDPDEVALPFDDLTFFEGVEPGDNRKILADATDLQAAFARESTSFRERWRKICLEGQVEYRFCTTDTPPAKVLRAFLVGRQKGRR